MLRIVETIRISIGFIRFAAQTPSSHAAQRRFVISAPYIFSKYAGNVYKATLIFAITFPYRNNQCDREFIGYDAVIEYRYEEHR